VKITQDKLRDLVREELSRADKAEIKRMISKEIDSFEKRFNKLAKPLVDAELQKLLKSKKMQTDVADISKKVLKKLYRDLAIQHPYIIDRIKL
jgi:glutamyl-tRNA reductase